MLSSRKLGNETRRDTCAVLARGRAPWEKRGKLDLCWEPRGLVGPRSADLGGGQSGISVEKEPGDLVGTP